MLTFPRRLVAAALAALALPLALVPAASAAPPTSAHHAYPDRIDLPDGFQPEGIEAGRGTTVYVGSLADGDIWRGDVRTGRGRVWAQGPGAPAVGLEYDARSRLLWVAGGPSGQVRAYDTRTARLVYTSTLAGAGFLNDVAITRRGVYLTDSNVRQLAVVRLGRDARPRGDVRSLPITGDFTYGAGFNANGIASYRGWLVVAKSSTGQLFRVSPRTGASRLVEAFGTDLTFADGLERRGPLLYVVRNRANLVQRLVLTPGARYAVAVGTLSGDTDVPTTGTYVAGALYVVNARFGTTPTPTTEYWITRLGR